MWQAVHKRISIEIATDHTNKEMLKSIKNKKI